MANALALVALLVAGFAALASAASYTVGGSSGWNTGVDYNTWASDKSFAVGDKLVFNYTPKSHTVTEVSKSSYDACTASTKVSDDDSGSTVIILATPGMHYYICNVAGHCAAGMKLSIMVSATPSSTARSGAAVGALVPAMGSVVAAAAGAAIKLALL
ncbi:hypothetical protein EJB05_43400 [Eragrostis curvula]|uniref:Phytocyanin domain-containing protein n=1 Tax=Eragrostis curvula TaxID=38414 RepID=A0A5J9TGW6_9POAL|nr:hypothetical protein EJB05_43400 [Eragrostis curvula]